MNVTTISDLRKNAKKYVDQVVNDDDIVVLSRPKGKVVVMVTMERFSQGMDTTAFLNSSKANREHLERGMADVEAGRTFKKSMAELKQYEQS
jgi:antitoxin YefM